MSCAAAQRVRQHATSPLLLLATSLTSLFPPSHLPTGTGSIDYCTSASVFSETGIPGDAASLLFGFGDPPPPPPPMPRFYDGVPPPTSRQVLQAAGDTDVLFQKVKYASLISFAASALALLSGLLLTVTLSCRCHTPSRAFKTFAFFPAVAAGVAWATYLGVLRVELSENTLLASPAGWEMQSQGPLLREGFGAAVAASVLLAGAAAQISGLTAACKAWIMLRRRGGDAAASGNSSKGRSTASPGSAAFSYTPL